MTNFVAKCGCNELIFDPAVRTVLNTLYGWSTESQWLLPRGYRCPNHPIEAKKSKPGEHTTGMCVDIACSGFDAAVITNLALKYGATRIGWNQKGSWQVCPFRVVNRLSQRNMDILGD
jgi:hypothetical protein